MEDLDSLLNDLNRELASYLSEFVFSEKEFQEIENRLDLINHLKSKYGHTIEEILSYEKEKEKEKELQSPRDSKDKALRQMEQGILEAAAADSRYSHLLNKEEEAIVKDVIKEFLT